MERARRDGGFEVHPTMSRYIEVHSTRPWHGTELPRPGEKTRLNVLQYNS